MASPIEDKNNPEFVGAQNKFKYLAIHGYEKFQRDKNGSLGDGSRLWIKDACRKDSDSDYMNLSISERYTLDGMRRLTGLHGKWCPNDAMWVARGLCVAPEQRKYVVRAVGVLVVRGLVTLSNERFGSLEVVEELDNNRVDGSRSKRERTETNGEGQNPDDRHLGGEPEAEPNTPVYPLSAQELASMTGLEYEGEDVDVSDTDGLD